MSSEWDKFVEQESKKREQQLARAEEEARSKDSQSALFMQKQAAKKTRENEEGNRSCQELEREAREVHHLDAVAQRIKQDWERFGVPVHVNTERTPAVSIQDNGRVINQSRVNFVVSYSYPDIETSESHYYDGTHEEDIYTTVETPKTVTQKVQIGLGYVTQKDNFAQGTENSVSSGELTRGVKSYFAWGTAIPLSHPGSQQLFFQKLYSDVEWSKPENQIPVARERVQRYNQGRR